MAENMNEEDYVCFCLWSYPEQELMLCCSEKCKKHGSKQYPGGRPPPIVPPNLGPSDEATGGIDRPIIQRDSEIRTGGTPDAERLRDAEAAYESSLIPPDVLHRPLNFQESILSGMGKLRRFSWIFRRERLWERIAPDAKHGRGCALVCAGLLPIIGAFFHECDVEIIPHDGNHAEARTEVGKLLAFTRLHKQYVSEMVEDKWYQVTVSKFGRSTGGRGLMASRHFDYFSPSEMPFLTIAVRHLLLYLGAGRDTLSTYRIYHDTPAHLQEGNDLGKNQILLGMVRFPPSPAPSTPAWAKMINLTPNTVPAPTLTKGAADWRQFCDSHFKDSWEDIRMGDFQYETYNVGEQRRFRQRSVPTSRTPSGETISRSGSSPASAPSSNVSQGPVTPELTLQGEAGTQSEVAPNGKRLTHPGIAPPSQFFLNFIPPPGGTGIQDGDITAPEGQHTIKKRKYFSGGDDGVCEISDI